MKVSTRMARRACAITAAAIAALLIPAVALAAPGRASRPADSAPRCLESQLRTWIGLPGDGTAGSVYYQLEISDISAQPCTLLGYPGVSAVGDNGRQLGSPAVRDSSHPARLITLGHDATAHVILGIVDAWNYPKATCAQVSATGLRVFAPNDFRSQTIPLTFEACQKAGPKFLNVSVALAGTGIPGYSY